MNKEDDPKKVLRIEPDPKVGVSTSIGTIQLHPFNLGAIRTYSAESPTTASIEKLRRLLVKIAGTEAPEIDKRAALTEAQARQLTDEDLERIAAAYLNTRTNQNYIKRAAEAKPPMVRDAGESSVSFLDRLLQWEIQDHAEEIRKIFANFESSTKGFFDRLGITTAKTLQDQLAQALRPFEEVRRQSEALNNSVEQFRREQRQLDALRPQNNPIEQFRKEQRERDALRPGSDRPLIDTSAFDAMSQHQERLRRERAEELDLARHTAHMTAQSATLLAKLADAATSFLRDFAKAKEEADRGTRRSIAIAAVSLVITAAVSIAAYFQDRANNVSNDRWQNELTRTLSENGRSGDQRIAELNHTLVDKFDSYQKTISALSAENAKLQERIAILERTLTSERKNTKKAVR